MHAIDRCGQLFGTDRQALGGGGQRQPELGAGFALAQVRIKALAQGDRIRSLCIRLHGVRRWHAIVAWRLDGRRLGGFAQRAGHVAKPFGIAPGPDEPRQQQERQQHHRGSQGA